MEFWGNLLKILDAKMQVPTSYGWFHLTFFAISVIAGLLLCRFCKNPSEQFVKRLLFISSLIVLILEVSVEGGAADTCLLHYHIHGYFVEVNLRYQPVEACEYCVERSVYHLGTSCCGTVLQDYIIMKQIAQFVS